MKGYPPACWAALKEIPLDVLEYEVRRRKAMREFGLCEHCEKNGDAAVCAKPEMHNIAKARNDYERLLASLNITRLGKGT